MEGWKASPQGGLLRGDTSALGTNGGGRYAVSLYFTPLNYKLEMVKMTNCALYCFYQTPQFFSQLFLHGGKELGKLKGMFDKFQGHGDRRVPPWGVAVS